MSRKDYELIASVLRKEIEDARANYEVNGVVALEATARSFARKLAENNPRFNGHTFLAACGVANY